MQHFNLSHLFQEFHHLIPFPNFLFIISETCDQEADAAEACLQRETVDFKIVYNKQKHDISFPLDDTVNCLKEYLEKKTGMESKVIYRYFHRLGNRNNVHLPCLPIKYFRMSNESKDWIVQSHMEFQ